MRVHRLFLLPPPLQRIIATAFLLLILTAAAADDNSRRLGHDQAVKDAKTFLSLLESTHADPYTNLGGKVAFKRRAQQLVKDIPAEGLTVGELGDRLSAFIVPLKDGHTRLSGASRERWVDPSPRLPVEFGVASDGMWVEGSDLPELKDVRGYKLVAVNGHAVPDMLDLVNAQLSLENIYGSYAGLDLVLHSYKRLKNVLPSLEQASGVTYTLASPQGTTVQKTVHWGGEHPEDAENWSDKPIRWSEMTRPQDQFYYAFLDNGRTGYFRVPTNPARELRDHAGLSDRRSERHARTVLQIPKEDDAGRPKRSYYRRAFSQRTGNAVAGGNETPEYAELDHRPARERRRIDPRDRSLLLPDLGRCVLRTPRGR
jgi:hypothetical protein